MIALRIINLMVWGSMLVMMTRGAWAAGSGRQTRHGDPMRLACLLTALVVCGFNLKYFLAPESLTIQAGLYILSAAVGCYIMHLARAYGRGPRV